MIYTKETTVEANIHVWAIPLSRYRLEDLKPGELPFEYRVYSGESKPYDRGSVDVSSITIQVPVPEGINLMEKAINTLEEARNDAYRTYQDTVADIEGQMHDLKLLSGPAEVIPIEGGGELVTGDNHDNSDEDNLQ